VTFLLTFGKILICKLLSGLVTRATVCHFDINQRLVCLKYYVYSLCGPWSFWPDSMGLVTLKVHFPGYMLPSSLSLS